MSHTAPYEELFAFQRNTVMVASAGTGKTHALVGVLIHLLLGASELQDRKPIEPGRVSATTFSRKAAAEIRERLQRELESLARGGDSPYRTQLHAVLGAGDNGDRVVARARRALSAVDQCVIGTLHGFAYSIARTHALALGLPPGFGVASEDDTEAWANEAVLQALTERARVDPDGVRDFVRLMRGVDRAQAELRRALLALEEDGRTAMSLALPEMDALSLEKMIERLRAAADEIRSEARGGEAASAFVQAHARGDALAMAKAAGDLFSTPKPRGDDEWLPLRDELRGTTLRDRGENLVRAWAARGRILPTAALVRSVLARAQESLGEMQAEAGAVGFGAVLRLARDALRNDPRAAAGAAGAYDALLVDEFQDTSRVQVELLRLLWERDPRSRTPGALPAWGDLRPRGLLVVGDRKQSIYAFRGADVGVFMTTCIELAGEKARRALGVPDGVVTSPEHPTADFFALRHNYRANASLIDLVNAFSLECLRPESDDLSEARYVEATEALVAPPSAISANGPRGLWLRPEGEPRDTDRLDDATLISSYIADEVARTQRPFRDFAVLAQSNEMLDAAAFSLSRAAIPHVVAGRGFFASREVQDLVSLLRCVDRPTDRVALLAVLRGVWGGLGDRTLLALTETHRGLSTDLDAWGSLDRHALLDDDAERAALERVRATLRALRRSAERLGPGPSLREAVHALELEQTLLLLPRGVQRIANVQKFLRIADRHATIASLLEHVRRAEERSRETEAATFSDDDDAVRLLTVHASKGLAFPVVLLPELHATSRATTVTTFGVDLRAEPACVAVKVLDERGEPLDAPSLHAMAERERARGRAEKRRLLYVAVTRAADQVVFVGGVKDRASRSPAAHATLGAMVSALAHRSDLLEVRECAIQEPASQPRAPRAGTLALSPVRSPVARSLSIAPTALQDFHHCARRFWLIHIVRLPEPERSVATTSRERVPGDARAEGDALHRLLESISLDAFGADDAQARARAAHDTLDASLDDGAKERVIASATRFLTSAYARRVRSEAAIVRRELPFVLTLEAEGRTEQVSVALRGAMDLVVSWPDGETHVIDYKRARGPDTKPHALQLDVYALAARERLGAARVRAGVVFLGGEGEPEPRFLPAASRERVTARVVDLARGLAEARENERFPRAAPKTCHAIGCRYFTLCHPTPPKRQLTLF